MLQPAVPGHEERGEPVRLLMRGGARAAALVAVLALLLAGCAAGDPETPTRPVVLVSGLDDHFMPESDEVPLHARPGGPVRGAIPAGSLARAVEVRGEWVKVTALELHTHPDDAVGAPTHTHDVPEGWVGDYYLRSRMHVIAAGDPVCPVPAFAEPGGETEEPLPPSAQVEFVTVRHLGQRLWVQVRTVEEPQREAWVPRETLSEYSSLQLTEGLGHVHGDAEPPPLVESTGECG